MYARSASSKQQAASSKQQAASSKQQAASSKLLRIVLLLAFPLLSSPSVWAQEPTEEEIAAALAEDAGFVHLSFSASYAEFGSFAPWDPGALIPYNGQEDRAVIGWEILNGNVVREVRIIQNGQSADVKGFDEVRRFGAGRVNAYRALLELRGQFNLPGDVNGDGLVNAADVTLLLGWLNGVPGSVETCVMDVNADGVINKQDHKQLKDYVGNGYPDLLIHSDCFDRPTS